MSKDDLSTHCKQRFKGIENFLRRVAFNLGNTPSQTEVKIISCIPIDVSDLQQKIINLERQLNEATAYKSRTIGENNTACGAALYTTNYPRVTNNGVTCNELDFDQQTISQKDRSNTTLRTPSRQKFSLSYTSKPGPSADNNWDCYINSSSSRRIRADYQSQPLMICEPQKEERRNFFRKKKKLPKKKKAKAQAKAQFVYYAQTSNIPFTDTDRWNVLDEMETKSDGITRSYLGDMVCKQYKPKKLGSNISDLSEYSFPVCRDSPPECSRRCPHESNVCSCCYGEFHNIDHQRIKTFNDLSTYPEDLNGRNAYYDSSLYDLVPVKEKPIKVKKDIENPVKMETKPQVDLYWPEDIRAVSRFHPYIVNYHTINPIKTNPIENVQKNLNVRNAVLEKMVGKRKRANHFGKPLDIISSKSCCVEFGKVYAKKYQNKPKMSKNIQIAKPQHKNAECLATAIQNSECQTLTSNVEGKKIEGKTEATLNQIKSILQSVLTEVKTNNQLKSCSEVTPKKDAVVQKGSSQNNLQGSTFLNSFSYSPYNMNPYIISGSQQINPSHFCYPQATLKYLQNFPLLIQSGRHLCNSCYRNNSNFKPVYTKQATTTSTNTDEVIEDRSKETQKLIKEIYKSMALTADLSNKDTSYSEYEYLQSIPEFESKQNKEIEKEKNKQVVRANSEGLLMQNIQTDTSSKFTSNAASTKSQYITTDTERPNIRVETLMQNKKDSVSVNTATVIRAPPDELDIATASGSESLGSEVESDASSEPEELPRENQKKEKKGIFSKMFQSMFKPKDKAKNADVKNESESESTSDSDDYQTVYSQKSDKQRYRTQAVNLSKIKTHSKISNSKQCCGDRSPAKRRPYMEKEYRRVWTEGIMFDKKGKMYSSERPYSKETTPGKHVYYRNYEARPVVVDAGRPYSRPQSNQMAGNVYPQGEAFAAKKRANFNKAESKGAKGLEWLKKHNMGIHCGDQWKKLILEG